VWHGTIDSLIGSVFGALSLIGIIHLIRASEPGANWLGWLALSGLVGAYAGFHLLASNPENFQLVMFTQAALVMPAGVWGLARMASFDGRMKRIAVVLIALGVVMGLDDLDHVTKARPKVAWSVADVEKVHAELQGAPFGYFGPDDRWWIPLQSQLAAHLGTRCARLNEGNQRSDAMNRHYFNDKPHAVLPRNDGETPNAWSLRFANKLGIDFVMEIEPEAMLPNEIKAASTLCVSTPTLRLYKLPTEQAHSDPDQSKRDQHPPAH
jgi:hypothetical protein